MTLEYRQPSAGTKHRQYLTLIGVLFLAAGALYLWQVLQTAFRSLIHLSPTKWQTESPIWWSTFLGYTSVTVETGAIASLLGWVGLGFILGKRWSRTWAVGLCISVGLLGASALPVRLFRLWLQFAQVKSSPMELLSGIAAALLPIGVSAVVCWYFGRGAGE